MGVITKGSNNPVIETCTNKFSVNSSVIHTGQRYTQSLRCIGEAVQVTILIITERSRKPSQRRGHWHCFLKDGKFQQLEMGGTGLWDDGKVEADI